LRFTITFSIFFHVSLTSGLYPGQLELPPALAC
jgi:hypothetical protein